jgi:hypothetical protein
MFLTLPANWRGAATTRGRFLVRVRIHATSHTWRSARCRGAGVAIAEVGGPALPPQALPRMADFAHWISACESAFWPAGTFARAYAANRRAAIESVIDGDPVASCVRGIMAQRRTWIGTAADLLCFGPEFCGHIPPRNSTGGPKNPRSLAGRLRRAQPGLRSLGIEIAFSREGRAGTRTISMSRGSGRPSAPSTASKISGREESFRPFLPGRRYQPRACVRTYTADDADGADASASPSACCGPARVTTRGG